MNDDVLSELQRENPIPEAMPALPIELVLRRLDDEPAPHARRGPAARRGAKRLMSAAPVALSLCTTALVVVVVIMASGRNQLRTPSATGTVPGGHHVAAAHSNPRSRLAIARPLIRRVAALRASPRATGVPHALATDFEIIATGPRAKYGIMTADATYVPLGGSGGVRGVWLLPGSHGMCFLTTVRTATSPGGLGCASPSQVIAGDLMTFNESFSPLGTGGAVQSTTIVGVVPNDDTSVSAVAGDGSTVTALVTDNTYVLHGPGLITTVKLIGASGATTTVTTNFRHRDVRRPAQRGRSTPIPR
jgi:hypothetical protein